VQEQVEADVQRAWAAPLVDAAAVHHDVTDAGDLDGLRAAFADAADGDGDGNGERVVTCFGVLERLDAFGPLVEALVEASEEHGATVLLSAAPDEGALAELVRLLPAGHVVARQVPLAGSAIVVGDEPPRTHELSVEVGAGPAGPTALLVAFGPGAARLTGVAAVRQGDAGADRARLRQLEADASLVTALLAERA